MRIPSYARNLLPIRDEILYTFPYAPIRKKSGPTAPNNRESTTSRHRKNYLLKVLISIVDLLPSKVVDQTFLAACALTDSRTMQSIVNRKPRLHSHNIAHQCVPSPSTKLSARGTSLLCGPVCSRVPRRRRNKICFGSVEPIPCSRST